MFSTALIGREFRAASRQKRIYGMRVLMALMLALALLMGVGIQFASRTTGSGTGIFAGLGLVIFLFASVFVIAQSCGSIADERRQGTLGLLLLTPLRPFEVVLGKFMARSCEGLQLCLVALPMIVVPFAMGGLTGGQILTVFVVILAQVMLCGAVSIFCSAFCKNAATAFGAAMLMISGYEILGVILAQAGSFLGVGGVTAYPIWTFLNPLAVVIRQFSMGTGDLAWSMLTLGFSMVIALAMIGLAAVRVPRVLTADFNVSRWVAFARARKIRRSRCRADVKAPIYWLEWGRWKSKRNIIFTVAIIALVSVACYVWPGEGTLMVFAQLGGLASFMLTILMIVSLVRNIQTQKQERIFELMLTAPITDKEWVNQRLQAAWRAYGIPLFLIAIVNALGAVAMYSGVMPGEFETWAAICLFAGTLMQSVTIWYMLAALSFSVGLSSKSMGSAIGLIILIYFGAGFAFSIIAGVIGFTLMMSIFSAGSSGMAAHLLAQVLVPLVGQFIVGIWVHQRLKTTMRRRIAEAR